MEKRTAIKKRTTSGEGAGNDANGRYKSGKETSGLGKPEIIGREVEKWGTYRRSKGRSL